MNRTPVVSPSTADTPEMPDRSGPFAWYADAGSEERRTLWSCKIGYALDAMDTQFLSFVIPALIATWGITTAQAGKIATVTLLTSALGGWLAGILSDRIGRVRTLQLTVAWFALFTVACGFAQNPTQLLIARGLMGFGFGGEWTAGAVLIGEVIRARDRGKAVGLVQSGWAIGWGMAALLYALVFSLLPAAIAWRVLFGIGIVPALFIFYVRRFVKEPDVHRRAVERSGAAPAGSFLRIFSPALLWTTLRGILLTTGAQGGYYAITTWLPTYLKSDRHLTVLGTGGYLAVVICGSYVGYVVSAYLSDRLGRRRNFMLYAAGSAAIALIYTHLPVTDHIMLALGFPLGFFASGIFSGMGATLTELFPTSVRGSGQGFCYNAGRAVGALFPWLIGSVAAATSLGHAIGIFAAAAYSLVIAAALLLPETRGRELVD